MASFFPYILQELVDLPKWDAPLITDSLNVIFRKRQLKSKFFSVQVQPLKRICCSKVVRNILFEKMTVG